MLPEDVDDQFLAEVAELLLNEDRVLEQKLNDDQLSFERFAAEQEQFLRQTLAQQEEVECQLKELRSHVVLQQTELGSVLAQVREMLGDAHVAPSRSSAASVETDHKPATANTHAPEPRGPLESLPTEVSEKESILQGEEVKRQSLLLRLVQHKVFEGLCTSVIFLNAIFIGVSVQYAVDHPHDQTTPLITSVDYFFLGFYVVELFSKLVAFRLQFFLNEDWRWNSFDLLLVLTGIYDFIADVADLESSGGTQNITIMRIFRLLKMLKMLRVVRVMRSFRELRLMLYSIVGSVRSLMWATLMLALIMYIFGLCFLQGAILYLSGSEQDAAIVELIEEHWSSVPAAMKSLFLAVSGGNDWSAYAESVEATGTMYYVLFLFYISFLAIVVLNILTGIFVDVSVDAAQVDRDNVIQSALEQRVDHNQVKDMLQSGNTLTREHLASRLKEKEVQELFSSLELRDEDAEELFDEFDKAGKKGVDTDEFAAALLKLKGEARSVDMVTLGADCKRYSEQLDIFMSTVEEHFGRVTKAIEQKCGGPISPPPAKFSDMLQRPREHFDL